VERRNQINRKKSVFPKRLKRTSVAGNHYDNGEAILTYANPVYDSNHDIAKTFIVNGDASVNDGYISLQSCSHPDFKKIKLLRY